MKSRELVSQQDFVRLMLWRHAGVVWLALLLANWSTATYAQAHRQAVGKHNSKNMRAELEVAKSPLSWRGRLLAEADEQFPTLSVKDPEALKATQHQQSDDAKLLFNDYNVHDEGYEGSEALFGSKLRPANLESNEVQGNEFEGGLAKAPKAVINLPTFENTPPPRKLSLRAWQETAAPRPFIIEMTSSLFVSPHVPKAGSGYVAACLIARDAHEDIAEWIFHHIKLGIAPVYVYDHGSLPPLQNVLRSWIDSGKVVYQRLELDHPDLVASGKTPQLYAYDQCLHMYGPLHEWIAFFDVDEYLVFTEGPPIQNIAAFLQRYERFSGLAVHWYLFGPNEHHTKPIKGTLKSYTTALPANHSQNMFVKSIVRPACTIKSGDSPHSFVHNCSHPTVRADLVPVDGHSITTAFPNHRPLALLHYATRSVEEFDRKIKRGSGMRRQRGWEYFTFINEWSVDYHFEGLRVWDDNLLAAPRTLNYDMIAAQDALYAQENHDDDFWKKAKSEMDSGRG